MYKLDLYTPKLIALMKLKGGIVGVKLRPHLDKLSQVCFFLLFTLFMMIGLLCHAHCAHIQHQSSLISPLIQFY